MHFHPRRRMFIVTFHYSLSSLFSVISLVQSSTFDPLSSLTLPSSFSSGAVSTAMICTSTFPLILSFYSFHSIPLLLLPFLFFARVPPDYL
ncbi:hypothetical protein CPB84DRAFT_1792426, partial [Gymnopilus junonius]